MCVSRFAQLLELEAEGAVQNAEGETLRDFVPRIRLQATHEKTSEARAAKVVTPLTHGASTCTMHMHNAHAQYACACACACACVCVETAALAVACSQCACAAVIAPAVTTPAAQ